MSNPAKTFENIIKINTKKIQESVSIWNNSNILKFFNKLSLQSYRKNEKNLTGFRRYELEKVFGKCNKTMRLEFYNRIWVLEYKRLRFNIFTAKIKGTSIEICNKTYEEILTLNTTLESTIIKFCKELHRLFNQ